MPELFRKSPFTHRALFGLIFFILLIRFVTLGMYPLTDKTESRYAEIAREMLASGDWIMLHLEPDIPFWGKPPLSIWATAASLKIFGLNEFAARFPSLLWVILTLVLIYRLAKLLADKTAALLALCILLSTGMFFIIAGSVMTDPALTAITTLIMVSFAIVMREPQGARARLWAWLFFTGLGLGILTKGPVTWVLTGLPIMIWIVMFGQVRETLRNFPWIMGMIWALLLAVPWHLLAEQHSPGFLNYYFVGEHWKRFTVSDWKGDLYGSAHVHPKGMIWLFMLVCTLPWSLIVLFLNRRNMTRESVSAVRRDPWAMYLWLWFFSPAVFFSLASNISIYYGLPGLPAFAILCAGWIKSFLSRQTTPSVSRGIVAMILFVPAAFLIAALTFLPGMTRLNSQKDLVAAFDKYANTDSQLVYIQTMPDSADFYARGRAVNLGDRSKSTEVMFAMLKDFQEEFYVVKADHVGNIFQEINAMAYLVGQYGEYILRRECGYDPDHVRIDRLHDCMPMTSATGE